MNKLDHGELIIFLCSLSLMLISSRVLAELGKKWKLPLVMGELIVGIILGPSVFGMLFPDSFSTIFPSTGNVPVAMDGLISLSVVLLLFVAGMEVQLPQLLKQGKVAMFTSTFSMVIPFFTGFLTAHFFPGFFGLPDDGPNNFYFALFLGTALSISALPVIARILMDLNLFRSKIGMVIIASAMFNDLVGWIIFTVILSLFRKTGDNGSVWYTIIAILGFGLFMLTLGKKIIDRILPWIQNKISWPGGVLSFAFSLCLISAAFTEAIHLHAILGAFIAGIAVGDSVHLHEKAREIIHQFITNFFAPLFFVSIGIKVNFIENFDLGIVLFICLLAYFGKLTGASLGAWWGGMTGREALAVGFGMNARGAMEIILGTLASMKD
jgi:Kef-type K+ transport system membrane component KefB